MGQLVLSRRPDERIFIGDKEIVIQVVEIRHGHVRIGIDAPRGVSVHREEVYEAIQRGDVKVTKSPNEIKGLAAANAEMEHYHKIQPPADDQVLTDKMEDERDGTA